MGKTKKASEELIIEVTLEEEPKIILSEPKEEEMLPRGTKPFARHSDKAKKSKKK